MNGVAVAVLALVQPEAPPEYCNNLSSVFHPLYRGVAGYTVPTHLADWLGASD